MSYDDQLLNILQERDPNAHDHKDYVRINHEYDNKDCRVRIEDAPREWCTSTNSIWSNSKKCKL